MVETALNDNGLGRRHVLPVLRRVRAGLVLDGGALGEILLPAREVSGELATAARSEVFLYADGAGRALATTAVPRASLGEVAMLKVVATGTVGAFLDWGLPKDLLLPFGEQVGEPAMGSHQLIKVIVDRHGRPVASARLDRHLRDAATSYRQGDRVALIAVEATRLGYKVVVDNEYWGLIGAGELVAPLQRGQRLTGYVGRLRDDLRLSISLHPPGAAKTAELGDEILARLELHDGFLPLSDKSAPDAIFAVFRCSKAAFKQAIGKLYKNRQITIARDGIRRI